MAKVEMFVRGWCPYCVMAKRLLQSKGQEWEEIDLDADPGRVAEMLERSGGRQTVPEIFIDDRHVGGYDDLVALERAGELDGLLG